MPNQWLVYWRKDKIDLSLFRAVENELDWFEVACQAFGTAIRVPDDAVLTVSLVGDDALYHVRAGRVRLWAGTLERTG